MLYGFLKDRAQIWYKENILNNDMYLSGDPELTFTRFMQNFATLDPSAMLRSYRNRKQGPKETVTEYMDDMERLLAETQQPLFVKIDYILAGMNQDIAKILSLRGIQDMRELRRQAVEQELSINTFKRSAGIITSIDESEKPSAEPCAKDDACLAAFGNNQRSSGKDNSSTYQSKQPSYVKERFCSSERKEIDRLKAQNAELTMQLRDTVKLQNFVKGLKAGDSSGKFKKYTNESDSKSDRKTSDSDGDPRKVRRKRTTYFKRRQPDQTTLASMLADIKLEESEIDPANSDYECIEEEWVDEEEEPTDGTTDSKE